jgi:(p)ppGpp synthase/HD superfamily hydrolase
MNQNMLSEMLLLSTQFHYNQLDKGGNPYILHPLKVMYYLKSDDVELQCIALGHDLIEDTACTYHLLRQAGMTERVIEGIRAMTKLPDQTPEEYLQQVLSNRDAMLVKLCDLRHNSDIRRLKGVTAKDIARIEKYHNMYLTIKERLNS